MRINVIWRCVRVTTVAVGKKLVLHILSVCCSISYIARIAHAPCYILICDLSGCTILFSTFSQKWQNFRGKKPY